jgi:hypothetical protein
MALHVVENVISVFCYFNFMVSPCMDYLTDSTSSVSVRRLYMQKKVSCRKQFQITLNVMGVRE